MPFFDVLATLTLWVFGIFVFISVALWILGYRYRVNQNKLLYYPEMPPDSREVCDSPIEAGVPNSELLTIRTVDGLTLRGFMLWPAAPPSARSSNRSEPAVCTSAATATLAAEVTGSECGWQQQQQQQTSTSSAVFGAREGSFSNGPGSAPPAFVLIYFHGNAGNVGHRLHLAEDFCRHLNCAVVMVDYRGYGLSSSAEPTQEGLEIDAQSCLDAVWNDSRVPRERIFVMGTSLGGAVAIHLAARPENAKRIAGLIIENTFTSVSDMISALGKPVIERLVTSCNGAAFCIFEHYIKPLVLKIRWRSVGKVGSLPQPLLFISGLQDELVPPTQMRKLYEVASAQHKNHLRRFVEFPVGMHNNLSLMPGYMKTIQAFVDEVDQNGNADVV